MTEITKLRRQLATSSCDFALREHAFQWSIKGGRYLTHSDFATVKQLDIWLSDLSSPQRVP